jgi:hypothetical protein
MFPVKIASWYRGQARRVYYSAVFEAKKGNPGFLAVVAFDGITGSFSGAMTDKTSAGQPSRRREYRNFSGR